MTTKVFVDLKITELNRVLDLVQSDILIKERTYLEFIKTSPDRFGHIEAQEWSFKGMNVKFIPWELVEYGGLWRIRNFTVIMDGEIPELVKVLQSIEIPT